ncbi:MAG: proline--tRNA ligase [Patescibacteria group bacterium]
MEEKKITARAEDYNQWYLDVIAAADLAEHSPVKGCMVIKPYGYAIWEMMQKTLDQKFKDQGVENAYFPLFIPESFLKREENHVEGFAPEVAVVTHAGGKKLEEPLVVRPTSETIMYEVFSNWIQSYRDLPLLINQWANVVRWELRTRLFLRTTEFLWQEGHTVHASSEEADAFARTMLDVYGDFAENYLAVPAVLGQKSDSEKFAGAHTTYCVEAMMQDGKALQFGTSHFLGQNFAKAFNVKFSDKENVEQFGWQTSWGVSTRMIGGLIMTHSDDKGLVVPPNIAPVQVVIIPLWFKEEQKEEILAAAKALQTQLTALNMRVKMDVRELRPGEKIFHWEKKGVPVRIELGPKDLAAGVGIVARRDGGDKESIELNKLPEHVAKVLENIQQTLCDRAKTLRETNTVSVDSWEEFTKAIEEGKFVMAHWSGDAEDEAKIKEESGATIRCLPFAQKTEEGSCVYSKKPSKIRVLFAKSY